MARHRFAVWDGRELREEPETPWLVTVEGPEYRAYVELDDVEMRALRLHMFGRGNDLNSWGRALKKLRAVLGGRRCVHTHPAFSGMRCVAEMNHVGPCRVPGRTWWS